MRISYLMLRHLAMVVFIFITTNQLFSQNVGINTSGAAPHASSMLDISSTAGGVLIPRMTLAQRNAIAFGTAAESMLIYQIDNTPGFYYNSSTTTTPNWVPLFDADFGWSITGNAGTTAGTNYLGTSDNVDLVISTNAVERMRINGVADAQIGFVGIGTAAPDDKLDVVGNAQVLGYLRVGSPSEPAGVNVNDQIFYYIAFGTAPKAYWNLVTYYPGCDLTDDWTVTTDHMIFTPDADQDISYVSSPFVWLPHYIDETKLQIEVDYACTLELNYDGGYIEFDHDGNGTFSAVSNINTGGGTAYTAGVDGSTTGCAVANVSAWTGTIARETAVSGYLALNPAPGSWCQFRAVGMEDVSNAIGEFDLYQFWLKGDNITHMVSGFEPGGIYAQGHIYAQSNSQIGDVAEFFPVSGKTQPGDLISMDPKGTKMCYPTNKKMDELVLGVHSTTPSIFVNDPKQGTPIGLSGRVNVNVVNENGTIKPGDYLTASSVPGKAMKATESCFVIGRALEHAESAEGNILCILNQGWYNPSVSSQPLTSGTYHLIPGKKTIRVIDENISDASKVFVSMRGNPGSTYWVSAVENGYFELELDNPGSNAVNFDYLVNNAHLTSDKSDDLDLVRDYIKGADETNLKEDVQEQEMAWVVLGNEGVPDVARLAKMTPPSAPPDPLKKWTWDPFNGFKEMGASR